jgi:hypothetical protein
MNERSERMDVASDALLDFFRKLLGLRMCIGNRWKCDNGHEWATSHCDAGWFDMPTTCPECGQTATAHRGEWQTIEQWSNAGAVPRRGSDVGSDPLFDKCVERKRIKDGTLEIHCKRGNWCVSGRDHGRVEADARHYWYQYKQDGEYDSLLSNSVNHTNSPPA